MKRSKFSEHQIIAILKAVEAGRTVRMFVASTKSAKQLTTSGSRSMAGWKRLTFGGCVNWKKRTGG